MVQCFLFPGGNRVVARLDPTMRLISSSNLRNCFRPPTAIVPVRTEWGHSSEALQCIRLSLLQENVENGWRQDVSLANSDSCLNPCVTIGHDRAGALVMCLEGFNYIN